MLREQPLPAPGLEGVRDEEEESRGADEERVGVVERPARAHEMPRAEEGDDEQHHTEACIEQDRTFLLVRKPRTAGSNWAIGALGTVTCPPFEETPRAQANLVPTLWMV